MFDRESVGSFLVRVALAGVLVWLAYFQIIGPEEWVGLIPQVFLDLLTQYVPNTTATAIVMGAGIVQIAIALLFVIGRFVAFAGFVSAIFFATLFAGHGFTNTGVLELALAIVSLGTVFRS
jgi:hypothetical protein